MSSPGSLILQPIGYFRTTASKRYEAPRQPGASGTRQVGRVILNEGQNFEQALTDLTGFDKIWLIYWFHLNENWKPMVQPPRGTEKRGVFATRSPHRPNPIGLSLVDLIEVKGRTLYVENTDLLDHTPILDIKPYLPYAEAHPDAKAGWIDSLPSVDLTIIWSEAVSPSEAIEEHLRTNVPKELVLSPETYPLPHPYRRIERLSPSQFVIAIQRTRVEFMIDEGRVIVVKVWEDQASTERL